MKKTPRARPRDAALGSAARRAWSLVGLIPPFALAFYSLEQPWARARVALVWGISRSPGTELTVVLAALAAAAAGASLLWAGRRPRLAATVHVAAGLALGVVAWQARQMIRGAGVPAIAGVRVQMGLLAFFAAAALLVAVGALELALWSWSRPHPRSPDGGAADPSRPASAPSSTP